MMDIKGYSGVVGTQLDSDYVSSVSTMSDTLLLAVDAGREDCGAAELIGKSIRGGFEVNPQLSKDNLQKYLKAAEEINKDASVTAVIVGQKQIGIANTGMNCLYQIRDNEIQMLTESSKKQIEILSHTHKKNDAFLLATEGFWKLIKPEEILIDYIKSDSAEAWLSYLLTRIGLQLKEDSKCYSAIAVMFQED